MAIQGCGQVFVAIAVQRWAPMVIFYQHLFNYPPTPHMDQTYAEFQIAGLKLGLFSPNDSHRSEFSNPAQSAMSLCLEVENIENSREAIEAAYGMVHGLASQEHNDSSISPRSIKETDTVGQNTIKQEPALANSGTHTPFNRQPYGEITIASHGRECYAYDPDGNRLILHESSR